MDNLLVLLFLDYASGGRDTFIRSILVTVGIFVVIGGFLAHPLLGIFLLIAWGAVSLASVKAIRVIGLALGGIVLAVAVSAIMMRPPG